MTHDIDDLLYLIKMLEERIIKLENSAPAERIVLQDDSYYWNHG